MHVTPESGAETRGITWGFPEAERYSPIQEGNSPPTITVDPGNGGGGNGSGGNGGGGNVGSGIVGGNDVVYEAGLVPNGSHAGDGSNLAYGHFTVSDPDGLSDIKSVTIDGTTIAIANLGTNNVIHGANGDLTITAYNSSTGVADYKFELKTPTTDVPGVTETNIFHLTTTDAAGATSTPATITIEITDDAPTAHNDASSVTEDAAISHIDGNVLTNDVSGADAPKGFTAWGTTAADTAAIADLAKYGTLHLNSDGTWSFDLNDSLAAVQGLKQGQTISDSISYTMHDADGSTSSASLNITINGTNDTPHIVTDSGNPGGGNDVVYEAGLVPNGSHAGDGSNLAYGHFTVSDPDGLSDIKSVTIMTPDNHSTTIPIENLVGTVISGGTIGNLTITSYDHTTGIAHYTYELTSPTTDVPGVTETDFFTLTTTDVAGATSAPATITIEIIDDVPTATVNFTQGGSVLSDETTDLGHTMTASGAVVNIHTATGADNEGATTNVKLDITAADSGLTTTDGHHITLVQGATDNDVLGKYDSNGDGTLEATAFKVTISDGGVLNVTQYTSLHHPDATNPNDIVDLTGKIDVVVTVTDGDGDVSTANAAVGQMVSFADDGPSITLNATNEAGVLLTTHDALTIGAASDTAHSTANFSGVFTVGASSYGADGAGTTATAYSLNLATGVLAGADSGLHSGGADIHLYESGGQVVGSTAATLAGVTTANTVFSLAVDSSTGVVTLTQNQAIDHSTPGDTAAPYDTQLAALSNGLVTLNATATITDSDGDKATSTQHVDLGGNIQFADDGPSITLNATNEAGVL